VAIKIITKFSIFQGRCGIQGSEKEGEVVHAMGSVIAQNILVCFTPVF